MFGFTGSDSAKTVVLKRVYSGGTSSLALSDALGRFNHQERTAIRYEGEGAMLPVAEGRRDGRSALDEEQSLLTICRHWGDLM